MEQERSFGYTVILGVCAVVSAVLIGKMVFYEPVGLHRPHAAVENAIAGSSLPVGEEALGEVTFSGAELTTLLRAALPEDAPVGDLRLRPRANGTLEASGSLEKEKLRLSGASRTLLLLLPERVTLGAVVRAGCDRESGALQLTAESLEAGGYGLPEGLAGLLSEQLTAAVNHVLEEKGIHFSSVCISEDCITFVL